MPAATNRADLIAVCEKEFDRLQSLLGKLSETLAMSPDEDGVSARDIIAHRAHWIDLFLGWYSDGQAGVEVFFPAKGYKWSELKSYNADLRAKQADMDWAAAQAALLAGHERLMWFLAKLDDDALYAAPMKGAKNDWPTGRWAEAAGASHYRSACKFIRARLRDGV